MPTGSRLCRFPCSAPSAPLAVVVLLAASCPLLAQFPEPRLTSLSRLGVRSGEVAELTLRGSDLEGASELWFDHPGLRASHVKDLTFRVTCAPEVPLGQHDVRVVNRWGVSNPLTFVVGDRPEVVESEAEAHPDGARAISINSVVHGAISAATEIDRYAFDGVAGQRLLLEVQAERLESPLDATLRLLDPEGRELAENRDAIGLDPFLDWTLPRAGRYVVVVHDAVYAGSPDHGYRLVVHDGPHLDAVLPLAASPGEKLSLILIGRGLGPEALAEAVTDSEGNRFERLAYDHTASSESPDFPRFSRLLVPASAASVRHGFDFSYTRSHRSGAAAVASNPVFLAWAKGPVVVEQEPNGDAQAAQQVEPPCDISGTFGTPGDLDIYRFPAKKGEVWKLEVIAERQDSPADPSFVIQQVGDQGRVVQDLVAADDLPDAGAGARFNTQSTDAEVRWEVPADGLYQVAVSDLYGSQRGSPRLTYRLVIRREQPDFRVYLLPESATGVDAVTIRRGGKAAAYVMAQRLDGFAGPIRVEAVALPPGVRCAAVTIAANEVLAPLVFEASEEAPEGLGVVSLVGHARFGDRKEELDYVAGVATLGTDLSRPALEGGMTRPPHPAVPTMAPARLFRGFVLAVRAEPAPLALSVRPEQLIVAQGRKLELQVDISRRAGFEEAVNLTAAELPKGIGAAAVNVPKESTTATLSLEVPKGVSPGRYSFIVRGTGAYPFSKDPEAKEKPKITLTEPSNPVDLIVRPAPLSLAIDTKGGVLKPGQKLGVEISLGRQNGFAGPVTLTLLAPAHLKLTAAPVSVPADQMKAALTVEASQDSPAGNTSNLYVRAAVQVRGEIVEVDEPLTLNIQP
jgi:hypothetical protein